MSITDNPIFNDADKARQWLERLLWVDGPVCPHCGLIGAAYALQGKAHRAGVYKCKGCDQQFTVTVGTVMERSHIPLNKWLLAFHLMAASKKGMSAHQMHRMLGLTYKTAWFMCHRIREAMREGHFVLPLGGQNKVVEADETYVGGKVKNMHASKRPNNGRGPVGKEAVVSLVEREGRVRSHHVPSVSAKTLRPILESQIDKRTHIMTDESTVYPAVTGMFAGHSTVNHGIEEYVRGGFFHTNTVEGYFSVFKRGIVGTYHHVSPEHLKRYLAEFDFRYNERAALGVNDAERMEKVAKGVVGKRVTYRRTGGTAQA
jgi:transposase-like protein